MRMPSTLVRPSAPAGEKTSACGSCTLPRTMCRPPGCRCRSCRSVGRTPCPRGRARCREGRSSSAAASAGRRDARRAHVVPDGRPARRPLPSSSLRAPRRRAAAAVREACFVCIEASLSVTVGSCPACETKPPPSERPRAWSRPVSPQASRRAGARAPASRGRAWGSARTPHRAWTRTRSRPGRGTSRHAGRPRERAR